MVVRRYGPFVLAWLQTAPQPQPTWFHTAWDRLLTWLGTVPHHLGDVGTWVQSIAVAAALLYLARDHRAQRWERRSGQASKVAYWYRYRHDKHRVFIQNSSDLPLYSVGIFVITDNLFAADAKLLHRGYVDHYPVGACATRRDVLDRPARSVAAWRPAGPRLAQRQQAHRVRRSRLWLLWRDAANVRWYRDADGVLQEGSLPKGVRKLRLLDDGTCKEDDGRPKERGEGPAPTGATTWWVGNRAPKTACARHCQGTRHACG
jgi:hypothetical protein